MITEHLNRKAKCPNPSFPTLGRCLTYWMIFSSASHQTLLQALCKSKNEVETSYRANRWVRTGTRADTLSAMCPMRDTGTKRGDQGNETQTPIETREIRYLCERICVSSEGLVKTGSNREGKEFTSSALIITKKECRNTILSQEKLRISIFV